MVDTKLKPCPFCGGDAKFLGETVSIKCTACGGCFLITNPLVSGMEAAEAWNRRYPNEDFETR